MARWYSTFSGSDTSPSIKNDTAGNRYAYLPMGATAATLKTDLMATNTALSNAFYAQIPAYLKDGTKGLIIPFSNTARSTFNISRGTNFTWTAGYVGSNANFISSRQKIITSEVFTDTVGYLGSTGWGGSITDSLYSAARQDVEDVFTAIAATTANRGLRERFNAMTVEVNATNGANGQLRYTGRNEALTRYRTAASIFYDDTFSYIAWDDFMPGAVTITADPTGGGPVSKTNNNPRTIGFSWSYGPSNGFLSDKECIPVITAELYGGGGTKLLNGFNATAGSTSYNWVINLNASDSYGGALPTGTYNLSFTVVLKHPDITGNTGIAVKAPSGDSTGVITNFMTINA